MLNKKIPQVPLWEFLGNKHLRRGIFPAAFAELYERHGPVFRISMPFRESMLVLAGPDVNRWAHRHGRHHLRVREYISDFERAYGAVGVLPALDGGDHFRLRKALSPAYSRSRVSNNLEFVYGKIREFMSDWQVGSVVPLARFSRRLLNAQISPMTIAVETQDILDDMLMYKCRALNVYIARVLPKMAMKTPKMRRVEKCIDDLVKQVQSVHTPAQRAGCPRGLTDDLLSLHASDPQLVPESNLRFGIASSLFASVYAGDAFGFCLYHLASNPEVYERIREEADGLFENGDPPSDAFTPANLDVTYRFYKEVVRMCPPVPMQLRNVMNTCVVEGYEIPVGSRVHIVQTASHYLDRLFPNPFEFDIDRYLKDRNESHGPGYAPYGLGTHTCLGYRWTELHLVVNMLLIAHYFTFELSPRDTELRIDPLPSMTISKKTKVVIAEQRRELPVSG